ncbi:uncharacterized protein AB675_3729 [Cyphellophora attinorum]|uniref:DNA recombination and repair protein Rad51-like C-terminal domain-containing protein n=1 Tax=Cyphellophora attinorum TaxID=1664694 RepID=A0A0N1GXW2_9EURO|nr:uncharacterized protein AB675_3729 [Phialophora attinorum]KPI35255.1 hypothetical protein AB675_3729 [Phialophora attinorum]
MWQVDNGHADRSEGNAELDAGTKVVWLATSSPLMHSRFDDIAAQMAESVDDGIPSSPPRAGAALCDLSNRFIYREVQVLAHLLVMLMHPTAVFPPPNTSVLVIDGLPNFLLGALPKQPHSKDPKGNVLADQAAKRANSKRFQVIDNLASALARLATSRHIAVVVLTNATTAIRNGQKAILKPALSRQGWDIAINTRIALYRDLYPPQYRENLTVEEKRFYRLAEVTRLNAKDVFRDPVPFVIETEGLRELDTYSLPISSARPPRTTPQRAPEALVPLEIRTSQLSSQNGSHTAFPTASQVLRQEYTVLDQGPVSPQMPVGSSQPLEPIEEAASHVSEGGLLVEENHYAGHPSRATKRKAIEIADSEDEDDPEELDLDLPDPSLPPPQPHGGATSTDMEPEEMLFDRAEYR